jgi:hypothetical protein
MTTRNRPPTEAAYLSRATCRGCDQEAAGGLHRTQLTKKEHPQRAAESFVYIFFAPVSLWGKGCRYGLKSRKIAQQSQCTVAEISPPALLTVHQYNSSQTASHGSDRPSSKTTQGNMSSIRFMADAEAADQPRLRQGEAAKRSARLCLTPMS